VVLTCRHKGEGGHWYRDEEERAGVYSSAVPFVAAIDAEIRTGLLPALVRKARGSGCCVIGSFHDFAQTPPLPALQEVVEEGVRQGADVIKLSTRLLGEADESTLLALLQRYPNLHLSVLGMGAKAKESRIRLACSGSCLVYGFLDASVAPGQVSAAELRQGLSAACPAYAARLAQRGAR
jgi:3-dehydroquinate dehydratase type I